jgi:hypothetical protein
VSKVDPQSLHYKPDADDAVNRDLFYYDPGE